MFGNSALVLLEKLIVWPDTRVPVDSSLSAWNTKNLLKITILLAITRTIVLLAICAAIPGANAAVISFTGSLRTDATFTDCGAGCTLGPANSDSDYAQWAAVALKFVLPAPSNVSAITFSYGGGVNGNGAAISQGGFEPYLSLFDSSGNFLASSGQTACPAGAQTNTLTGDCYDVGLTAGVLPAGTYSIAISAFENMSYAENSGGYLLADGFTGLGNLAAGEDLHYAFDVVLASATPPAAAPEPSTVALVVMAGIGSFVFGRKRGIL